MWLFIAGMPWAGLGACMLAWCGSKQPLRAQDWCLRIAAGIVATALARLLFDHFPQIFLPLYDSMASQYADLKTNPNLRRLINDSRAAIQHPGKVGSSTMIRASSSSPSGDSVSGISP